MTSINKQAEKDALEWTQAKLAYGEGAGNRRKLINETVAYKKQHIPGYESAFNSATERQDVAHLAKHAKRDSRRKTVNQTLARNTKAIATGKYENVNTGLLIFGAAAVIIHKTGYDKVVIAGVKRKYKDVRRRLRKTTKPAPAPKRGDDNVYRITDLR
jgi:hypothetical protein